MKENNYSIYDLAISILQDKHGASEETYKVLMQLLKLEFKNHDSLSSLMSSVEECSNRYYITYGKTAIGEVYVSDSLIHEKGVFSKNEIASGTAIFLAADLSIIKSSPSAQFVNHSDTPNCFLASTGNDLTKAWLASNRKIEKDEELTLDYKSLPMVNIWQKSFFSEEEVFKEKDVE